MKKFVLLLAVALFGMTSVAEAQLIRSSRTVITKTKKEKKELTPVKAGMQQEVSLEAGGLVECWNAILGVNYTIGYRFNNTLFLGGGIGGGYNDSRSDLYAQAFADVRAYLTKTRVQPFFDLSAGYCMLEENLYGDSEVTADGGLMIAPQFGINCRLSNRIGLNFGIGVNLLIGDYADDYYPRLKIGLSF